MLIMITSKEIHTFKLSVMEGHTVIMLQKSPWSVLQVVPATPETFDEVVAKCKKHGIVAVHGTDRTFCIIHIGSGDHDGKRPEHHVTVNASNYKEYLDELKDVMGQAAVWYYTNVIAAA